jgi:hypothetical protein
MSYFFTSSLLFTSLNFFTCLNFLTGLNFFAAQNFRMETVSLEQKKPTTARQPTDACEEELGCQIFYFIIYQNVWKIYQICH